MTKIKELTEQQFNEELLNLDNLAAKIRETDEMILDDILTPDQRFELRIESAKIHHKWETLKLMLSNEMKRCKDAENTKKSTDISC